MNISSQVAETLHVAEGQPSITNARLIIGLVNDDPPFASATGGPGETYGNPDPANGQIAASGSLADVIGTPDPVSAFANASGFNNMRLISEPVGIFGPVTGAVGGAVGQLLDTQESIIAAALAQAQLDRFLGAMAGFIQQEAGTTSPLPTYSDYEPARVQIAASLAR